jgi:hypothetical protein
MTEVYPNPIWDRKKWQTERDSAGVAKGACSKVSAGDEIERFHKDFAKGYEKYASATQRLVDKLGIYCATLEKSKKSADKDWAKRVRKQFVDKGGEMLGDFQKIADARDSFKKGVQIAKAVWPKLKTEVMLSLTLAKDERPKIAQMKTFVTGLQAVDTHGKRLRYATDEVTKEIQVRANKAWYFVDGGGEIDVTWVNAADQLVKDLPVLS